VTKLEGAGETISLVLEFQIGSRPREDTGCRTLGISFLVRSRERPQLLVKMIHTLSGQHVTPFALAKIVDDRPNHRMVKDAIVLIYPSGKKAYVIFVELGLLGIETGDTHEFVYVSQDETPIIQITVAFTAHGLQPSTALQS
jgi:hypothetical protein